jgi:phosphatidylethanolamine-binding protein (PEBP) family uncharacterized protein
MALELSSPAFAAGGNIPRRFTCDGDDVPPPLTWTGAPAGTHRYYFRLSALDVPAIGLKEGASREQVERAMTRHAIATAELMGRYSRRLQPA